MSRITENNHMQVDHSWHLRKDVNIGTIVTVLAVVVALVVWKADTDNRIAANAKGVTALTEQLTKTLEVIKANKDWQVEQRQRVWNRLNENETIMQANAQTIAEVKAGVVHANKQLDRLLNHIIEGKGNRQ